MSAITVKDALKKYDRRLYKQQLREETASEFLDYVKKYISQTSNAIQDGESEEHLKNITNSFLRNTFYGDSSYEINTDKRIDSAIKENGEIRVLIENKNPKNKSEMVSADHINVKALHEVIFYYLTVTRNTNEAKVKRKPDIEIRRIIITDTKTWAVIDANEIEKLVDGYLEKHFFKYINKQLIYSNNTDKFYSDTKQYLDSLGIENNLPYVYFDISEFASAKNAVYLYKILSKNYLLKDNSRYEESSHTLNEGFYQELLYIMGLKEKVGNSVFYLNTEKMSFSLNLI